MDPGQGKVAGEARCPFCLGVCDTHPDSYPHSQPGPCSSLFTSFPECPPRATLSTSLQARTSHSCAVTATRPSHTNSCTHAGSGPGRSSRPQLLSLPVRSSRGGWPGRAQMRIHTPTLTPSEQEPGPGRGHDGVCTPAPVPPFCSGCWPQRTGQAPGLGCRLRSVFPVRSSGWELPADALAALWRNQGSRRWAGCAACVHIHVCRRDQCLSPHSAGLCSGWSTST